MNTLFRLFIFCVLVIFLSGVNYCQKDFIIGGQVSSTPTATPTSDDDEEVEPIGTATPTGTVDVTNTATPTATVTATPKNTATATPTPTATTVAASLLQGLAKLESQEQEETGKEVKSASLKQDKLSHAASRGDAKEGNWLGKSYSDSEEAGFDTDRDGYTDQLELDTGSDPKDSNSVPPLPVTRLNDRFEGIDDDRDGVVNKEEKELGLNLNASDTDNDGIKDGAEILSGTNPLDAADRPVDADGDGLADAYELEIGTNVNRIDSDGDQLSDSVELALASSPLNADTDGDGILDGKEVELGSDPIISEQGAS